MNTSDDWLIVALGDEHGCGTTAAMLPWENADGVKFGLSKAQEWLLQKRDALIGAIKRVAVGRKVALLQGGDTIQGDNAKACQFVGTTIEQADNMVRWLMPFANMAERVLAVTGTEFHCGPNGSSDRYVAAELGATIENYRRVEIGGRVIDWTHHAQLGGGDMTDSLSLLRAAKEMQLTCLKCGERLPDLMLSHHVHRSRVIVADNGITAATCGCWQLPTMNIFRMKPRNAYPDIGGLLYFTKSNRVVPITWRPAMPPVEHVS